MHLFDVFYLLFHQRLSDWFCLEVLHRDVVSFGDVSAKLSGSLWSIVSLLEGVVLLGPRNEIIRVAMNARIYICQHLFLIFLSWIRNHIWHVRLMLFSPWNTIGKLEMLHLKMLKMRNIGHSFSSSTIDLPASRAIESLLNSLVLTSTARTDIVIDPQLLLGRNLTLNSLYLLISRLLCLHWHDTSLLQLPLLNGTDHLPTGLTLHVSGLFILTFLKLILLFPCFKHMYLILLYFLYVLNLLLL